MECALRVNGEGTASPSHFCPEVVAFLIYMSGNPEKSLPIVAVAGMWPRSSPILCRKDSGPLFLSFAVEFIIVMPRLLTFLSGDDELFFFFFSAFRFWLKREGQEKEKRWEE